MQWFIKVSLLIVTFYGLLTFAGTNPTKPHIVLIIADDLGYNDIGFHGSDQIPTPNFDALSAYGISLKRFYAAPLCTPSRSSLMTGKYPSNVGMQHYVIAIAEPWGLGLNNKILPEYMKQAGYATHLIGKWHLGFYQERYTPLYRGFDTHNGYLGPFVDYYNHSISATEMASGFDMRNNLNFAFDTKGLYATDLFTDIAVQTIHQHNTSTPMFMSLAHLAPHAANEDDPLQAPRELIEKFSHIKDEKRRKYAAMVSKLDTGIGKVVTALKQKNMLENSVILFIADNGAPSVGYTANSGSNFPFRGQKDSPWEGAVRTSAAIWSTHLLHRQRVSDQLIHISDWLPTFANLAGVNLEETKIDGHDMWDALSLNLESPRKEVLCHYESEVPFSSYILDDWKYVNGSTHNGKYDYWIGEINETEKHQTFEKYGQSIIESEAGQALSPFSQPAENGHTFNAEKIENLRKLAAVECQKEHILPTDSQFWCNPLINPCLFNITEDPCEQKNLAALRTDIVQMLEQRMEVFRKSAMPPRNRPTDPRANPKYFNFTWTWWYDELHLSENEGRSHAASINLFCRSLIYFLFAALQFLY